MIFYVLLHRPTLRTMPAVPIGGTLRGWTYWEPVTDHGMTPPRLFARISSARKARTAWLKGNGAIKWSERKECYIVNSKEVEGRNPDDLEIICVKLEEVPCGNV